MSTAVKDESTSRLRATRSLRFANSLLLLSVVLALTFAVILYRRNVKLTDERARLVSTLHQVSGNMAGPPSAQVGDVLPSFETTGKNGQRTGISYDGKSKYLLYIFSPQCEVCAGELPTWKNVANQARTRNIRVVAVGIYMQPPPPEKEGLEFDFESMYFPSLAVQRAYRVIAVPSIMLVSNQGIVEWVHNGSLSTDERSELLRVIAQQ